MSIPKAFISYSWDDDEHKSWVIFLAIKLHENGVKVFLDQWDAYPGIDLPAYMETCIRESDYVLLVCTPNFAKKANSTCGGVGYEKIIVTGEIFEGLTSPTKFVPLLRAGQPTSSLPSYLKSKLFIDFRDDNTFEKSLEELLRHLHKSPKYVPPPIGNKPLFQSNALSNFINADNKQKTNIYCRYCGSPPGTPYPCYGANSHDFKPYTGKVYCHYCGSSPGTPYPCYGASPHDFKSYSSKVKVLCIYCGSSPGTPYPCYGASSHEFKEFK